MMKREHNRISDRIFIFWIGWLLFLLGGRTCGVWGASNDIRQTAIEEEAMTIEWEASEEATAGYRIEYYPVMNAYASTSVETEETFCTLTGLMKDTKYTVRVFCKCPLDSYPSWEVYYGSIDAPTLPQKITGLYNDSFAQNKRSGIASFRADQSPTADCYEYEITDSEGKRYYTAITKSCSFNVDRSELRDTDFYSIRMRGVVSLRNGTGSVSGEWSDPLWFAKLNSRAFLKKKNGKLLVKWEP